MSTPTDFFAFVRVKGRSLSEINPGSDEWALTSSDAIHALELLAGTTIAVLGGDVLTDPDGKLGYTDDSWYCERVPNEKDDEYVRRSQSVAHQFIETLLKRGQKDALFVLVTGGADMGWSKPL